MSMDRVISTLQRSIFGQRLSEGSGIGELMDDLGDALAAGGDQVRMLGGGQPAHIPEMDDLWRKRWLQIADDPDHLSRVLGNYEPPIGNSDFRNAIADLFSKEFGWPIGPENVAITPGAQTAFFFLFNMLAGEFQSGVSKKILLPIIPEYIGYANQAVGDDIFQGTKPQIELIGDHQFKYRVDFENVNVTSDTAAICVSRPTNPTGNVLTDDEIQTLSTMAIDNDVPLIIDNAYGAPFPGAIYTDAQPIWDEHIILTLSLSKLGLPGTRTGIVIANPEIARGISSMTSIVGLANTNIGQAIVQPLVEDGQILKLSREVILPYYRQKSEQAVQWMHEAMEETIPYRIHVSEGAFFLWLWFKDLPISSKELYQRLKARDVLVVPGDYFFYGNDTEQWPHSDECLRVTFTMPEDVVKDGFKSIAEEVRKAYQSG